MADEKSTKRVLKPESSKPKEVKVKASQRTKGRAKVASGLSVIFSPLRWLGKYLVPRYFKNSFAELKLVTWPNRRETRRLTTAVILFSIALGTVVSLTDYGLDKLFKKVILKQ